MTFNFYTQDFNLPAGGTQVIVADGAYLKLLNSTGTIRIRTDSGITMKPLAGQGFRRQGFTRIEVTDLSGAANSGTFAIASEDMVDDRITGEVSVIDGGKSRVISGASFMSPAVLQPGAGAYGHMQIYNPAGSGKNIIVNQIALQGEAGGAAASGLVAVRRYDAQLGTDSSADRIGKAGAAYTGVHRLLVDVTSVSSLGATKWGGRYRLDSVGAPVIFRGTEPVVVTPGVGLLIASTVAGFWFSATVEGYEE